jgi:hypothetical protein
LLEQLLFSSKRLQAHDSLSLSILFSLSNVNHLRRFFQDHATEKQQLAIVDKIDDPKTLARLAKCEPTLQAAKLLENKRASLTLLAEKPIKIQQQVSMINSRLLALKEVDDYGQLSTQLKVLSDEFDTVKPEFGCLDEAIKSTLTEKYLSLKIIVQQKLNKLETVHKHEQELKQTFNDIADIQERLEQVQIQIDLLSSSYQGIDAHKNADKQNTAKQANSSQIDGQNVKQNIDAEVKILSSSLVQAKDDLMMVKQTTHAQTFDEQVSRLEKQIQRQHAQLLNVFDIVEFAQKGKLIIEQLAALISDQSLPASAKSAIDDIPQPSTTKTELDDERVLKEIEPGANTSHKTQAEIAQFRTLINSQKESFTQLKNDAKNLMPARTEKAFHQTLTLANKLLKSFSDHYKKIEDRCDVKLKVVNRMIRDGKYKSAMSTFHHLQKMFSEVSESCPARLQKAFEQTSIEINKLQDWQAYIAVPRKPALIKEAELLANSQFEDPYERSRKVKELRQQYNSLGLLHTPDDDANNAAFDQFIEKAFVPCRAFFAELERQRELNYQKAQNIIEQAKAMDANLSASELASKMGALKSQFNKVGEIEKSHLYKVKRDFAKALKSFTAIITQDQQQNAQQKQSLIKQAIKINQESLDEAALPEGIDKAKALQQMWKQIGFAGKNVDNELWHAFRQANDELFSRFHQNLNDKKDAQQANFAAIDKSVNEAIKKLKGAKQLSDLQFFDAEQAAIVENVKASDEANLKKLQSRLRLMDDIYTQKNNALNEQKDASALANLFKFLETYASADMLSDFDDIPGRYKSWVRGDVPSSELLSGLNRAQLTHVAAILLDVNYQTLSFGDEASRKDLQLKIMAAKLQGDGSLTPETVLAHWVSLGPVDSPELRSLQAMRQLFVA